QMSGRTPLSCWRRGLRFSVWSLISWSNAPFEECIPSRLLRGREPFLELGAERRIGRRGLERLAEERARVLVPPLHPPELAEVEQGPGLLGGVGAFAEEPLEEIVRLAVAVQHEVVQRERVQDRGVRSEIGRGLQDRFEHRRAVAEGV